MLFTTVPQNPQPLADWVGNDLPWLHPTTSFNIPDNGSPMELTGSARVPSQQSQMQSQHLQQQRVFSRHGGPSQQISAGQRQTHMELDIL